MADKVEATFHGESEEEHWRRKMSEALLGNDEVIMRESVAKGPIAAFSLKMLLDFSGRVVDAMQQEGVDYAARTWILNRVLYGHRDGMEVSLKAQDDRYLQLIWDYKPLAKADVDRLLSPDN